MKNLTVIIPTYDSRNTIERCLASLISNKDYISKVIIVDDHSHEEFECIDLVGQFIRFFPIQYIKSLGYHNPGMARKTGLLDTFSEWVTFVDSDDCLTPNSIHYIEEYMDGDTNLIHTKSIFYESGEFNPESINFEDTSCGGNFYRTKYLIDNNLFPHDELRMSEDEYFNEKVIFYINNIDKNPESIVHFDYPVYEVHHDIYEYGQSFAIRNWVEYTIKSHLLCTEYFISDFILHYEFREELKQKFINSFIFCYYMSMCLMRDTDVDFKLKDQIIHFKRALFFFEKSFQLKYQFLIDYFNTTDTKNLQEGAEISTGIKLDGHILKFSNFVLMANKTKVNE